MVRQRRLWVSPSVIALAPLLLVMLGCTVPDALGEDIAEALGVPFA
jgi:hypothetical protein